MQDKTVEMHMQCSMDCLALFGVASLRFFVDNVAFLVWFFIVLDETKRVCCVLCVSVCVCVCAACVVALCAVGALVELRRKKAVEKGKN